MFSVNNKNMNSATGVTLAFIFTSEHIEHFVLAFLLSNLSN